ncbi:MAG: helix-turn-helix domain-containing protein [Clostridia bacterium]|nr:helix-turn-helix domain-containing protein [Clostridia bacterium]
MTYSEKVKNARERLLLTQDEMATELGVNAITVCRWETGKSEPNMKAKKAIRDFCIKNGLKFED